MEIYKQIKGFEGMYSISNEGKVKSLARYDASGNLRKEKILKLQTDKYGYLTIGLFKNGKKYYRKVHRLVASAFIPNPHNKEQVNHIDGDKQNNHVSNLEWNTPLENTQHSINSGLRNNIGSNNPSAKLNEEIVYEILLYKKLGENKSQVNREIYPNINRRTFGRVWDRDTWKHVEID